MNMISLDKRNAIIELGKTQQYTVKDISKMTSVSCGTICALLKKLQIPLINKKQARQFKLRKDIEKTYEETQCISSLLREFCKSPEIVFAFIDELNLTVNDEIILDLFDCDNPHIRFHAIEYRISKHNSTKFENNVIKYLAQRFYDSQSFMETYVRIKNGIYVRPTCEQCGNPVKFVNSSEHGAFQRFCCKKCSNSNELTKVRLRAHNIKVYGVPVTSQAQCVKDKAKKHFQETLGVDNPWQSKEVQEISRQTKKMKYGNENYNNRLKSEVTCLDRYGVKVSSQNAEVQRKASISYHLTVFEKFGTEWPMQNDDVRAKFHNAMSINYSSTSYLSSNDFKKKCLELYGVENPMQCSEIRKKTAQKYSFIEISFDSAPEIAFFIWLKDNNIEFEYQPNVSFEYEFAGKVHKYFPDFKVGDVFFEIKGDHFFKDDKMICPYREYEAKHQCMLVNDVVILRNAEYAMFVQYVKDTYGSSYLMQFKTCK